MMSYLLIVVSVSARNLTPQHYPGPRSGFVDGLSPATSVDKSE